MMRQQQNKEEQLKDATNKPLLKATSHCPFELEGRNGQKVNSNVIISFLSESRPKI